MAKKSDNLSADIIVDNPDEAVDPNNSYDEADGEDFFRSLDASVNSMTLEGGDERPPADPEEGLTSIKRVESADESGEAETLKKRYSDSSREAKRLNKQLQNVEPYLPILDALKNDPNLRTHVREYYESGKDSQASIKEKLNLSEDFVFDGDEAVSNPTSESAKVLEAAIDSRVQGVLGNYAKEQQQESQQAANENSFRTKHEMGEDEWEGYMDYARSHKLTYDDILYLKNRERRDNNIAKQERSEMFNQMKNARSRPTSVSTTRGQQAEDSPDDAVFNAIKGIDSKLEEAFSS
jgi:hypothetical protein